MVEIYQIFGVVFYPANVDGKYDQKTRNISNNTKRLYPNTVPYSSKSQPDKLFLQWKFCV